MQQTSNDFSLTISTINGSGSATANSTIHRAIYKMGIPVSGRNIFPSNIQGLPTWYSIRVSEKGYLGRTEKDDLGVCLNKDVISDDLARLKVGGIFLLDELITIPESSSDKTIIPLPIDQLLKSCDVPANLKVYLANMVYVGVIARLIGIDLKAIEEALHQHFNGRQNAIDPNVDVINTAFNWAEKNIGKDINFGLNPLKNNKKKIMVDGNSAAALGALYGGLQFAAWYPITPATEIAETLNEHIPQLRYDHKKDETTCVVVQAEDELASIGMVIGAGWAGLRAMTATSGPGLCLMSEFLGLAYFTEVPIVVWDVQRVGPSTGLPTRTSQGDLSFAYSISHGDADFIILLPGNVQECFEFGWKALDLAERYQTPVIILSDLELGMNLWTSDQFLYPDSEIDRGKVFWEEDLEKLVDQGREWGRYLDIDGDGIPFRTIPGNMHPAASYFARGTGHDEYAHYSEDPDDWKENLDRLKRKYLSAVKDMPLPVPHKRQERCEIGLISYGSTDMAVLEAIDMLDELGIIADYLRIRAIPFDNAVKEFSCEYDKIFVIECNRDGQMKGILSSEFPEYAHRYISIAKIDGLSLSAEWIVRAIEKILKEN